MREKHFSLGASILPSVRGVMSWPRADNDEPQVSPRKPLGSSLLYTFPAVRKTIIAMSFVSLFCILIMASILLAILVAAIN